MKKLFSVMAAGILLGLMLTVTAHAQEPGTAMRASIPFDFMVRGKTLPAGNYEIRRINHEPIGLVIQNVNHRRDEAMFQTDPIFAGREPRKSLIVFHRYGDSYFLSEVVTAGEDTARGIMPSRAERALRREMASNKGEPETVAVAVN